MKGKKYGIVLGAVAIILLMISTSTAVGSTNYVDKNVKVGVNKLSTLEKSLQYIDNQDVRSLVQAIINEIKRDGLATSKDIQQIEEDLGIFFPIHAGRIRSGGYGSALSVPGLILIITIMMRWGPAIVAYWSGEVCQERPSFTAETYINLIKRYEGNHEGYIIGFLGYCSFGPGMNWMPTYSVMGTAALIIVITG